MALQASFSSRKGNVQLANLIFSGSLFLAVLVFSGFFARIDTWLHDIWLDARLAVNASSTGQLSFLRPLMPQKAVNDEITVVVIDDRSILGIPGLYQGSRQVYADAIRQLNRFSPKVIALDVFFAAASEDAPEADQELVQAVQESGRVVLRAFRRDDRRMTPPFPELARSATSGPTFFRNHRDESVRSVSLYFTTETGKQIPSFQTETWRIFRGIDNGQLEFADGRMLNRQTPGDAEVPLVNHEFMLLNYDLPLRSFRTLSFFDVINGNIPEEAIKDKAVIIGAANSMTEEKLFTPVSGNDFSPFLNALALRNLLQHSHLTPAGDWQGPLLAAIMLVLFMFVVFNHLQPLPSLFASLLTIPVLLGYSLVSFTISGKLADVSAAVFCIAASLIFTLGRKYYLELSEKLRIKTAFQHYVTASVVNEILKNPAKLNLHGEERDLTIFFSDIEGFTSLSEGMSPLDVVSLLNEYLTAMTDIIFKFDGLLDKYEGDAIMAVFGAPVDQKDHAIRACRCALENQKVLRNLREKWRQEGRPEIRARIGINTGIVVVGNMGSTMRFDYTVIGDNVNLAARLETGNKLFSTEILVSEQTATLAESAVISRCLAKLKVAGKANHVNVYEVLADRLDPDKKLIQLAEKAKSAYESAQKKLMERDFVAAEVILAQHLQEFPADKPAAALHAKVKGFLIVPPPAGWENIVTQDLK